ncbi:MAG: SMC family ATPase, partial [Mycobacteriales bacterium]
MRPHRLRLTAFGPFAQTVDVDLDALSSAGVFLLHGETGAGKTTLLDGIGFALYGRVPGERGKAKRLRSDHATAELRTSVELEASFAGRRLRIVRSPQQDKPSSRGGSTTVQAKVQLDELVGDTWTSLSTRVGEADAEIADLMGMSAEQFFQVVLLPQGEFATFLRADATKRGELLARLFGTDRYRFVEDWLADQRRRTAEAVSVAEQQLRVLGARLSQAAGVDVDEELQPAWVTQVAAAASASAERAVKERALATAAQQGAEQEARAAGELAALQDRRRAAQARQRLLDGSVAELAALAAEDSAARQAAVVRPRLLELDRRRAAALAGGHDVERACRALIDLGAGTVPVAELLRTERARAGRLVALRSVADAWTGERAGADAAQVEVTQALELLRTTR